MSRLSQRIACTLAPAACLVAAGCGGNQSALDPAGPGAARIGDIWWLMLAVCAAGRILNPKSARSQVIGAMTMGVGAALMEELAVDKRFGFFVNHDLATYEVPVHADIPHQEVIFLDETDPISSPMKAKGVGELGICGVGGAIANAIYNATGVRVRDYPITLDKLLDRLPEVG
jgi:xanthine dehydrogenase YagR molybdenum-binding subunit